MTVSRNRMLAACIAVLAIGFAGVAPAATVDVTSVNGSWIGLRPTGGPNSINGIGTSTVRWGTPYRGPGGTGEQSAYSFQSKTLGSFESGVEFDLGTFTHFNKTITGMSITGADLGLGVSIAIGGVSQVVAAAFRFDHWETENFGDKRGNCQDGGKLGVGVNVNGCADRVRILNNSGSANQFAINGVTYVLEITGFLVEGKPFTEFWTQERADNSAVLRARFTEVGGTTASRGGNSSPSPSPSPVPLPGAAWLILSALAAMGFVGRRRKSA
jgi:hypothetical protein